MSEKEVELSMHYFSPVLQKDKSGKRAAGFQATPRGLSPKAAIACFSLDLWQSCYHGVKHDIPFVLVDNFLSIKNR